MASWAQQRRLIYGSSVTIVILGVAAVIGYLSFYKAPTCFDGLKNGDELGIDCGGSCVKMCASSFIQPRVLWTRFEQISPGILNVASMIENLNVSGEAFRAPYHLKLYDNQGILITEYDDTFTIPPGRNTLAFRGDIDIGSRIPATAQFTFTGIPDWHRRDDPLAYLVVIDKQYSEDNAGSYLTVKLNNTSVRGLGKISVYAILYDKSGNAIGFSRTVMDGIAAGGTAVAPFTWPTSHHGAVVSTDVLRVVE